MKKFTSCEVRWNVGQ